MDGYGLGLGSQLLLWVFPCLLVVVALVDAITAALRERPDS